MYDCVPEFFMGPGKPVSFWDATFVVIETECMENVFFFWVSECWWEA
jgi:hypothetical protein